MLNTIQSPVGAEIVFGGRRYTNFGGSSYLGLSHHPEILKAGEIALHESGSGYQFPRPYGLATRAHLAAEAEAAEFFGTEAALYVAAGYYFGLIATAAMRESFTSIFYDELAHHSLRDGAAASGRPSYAFRHLDADDLAVQLKRHCGSAERPLITTDGMFATFGEIAPLDQYAAVIAAYDGYLLVDESHSFGVLGESGRGANEHHHISASSALIGGSTGKGLGVLGGIIPAGAKEIERFRATPAGRGASSGLPAAAAMCAQSLRYIRRHPDLLIRLRENVRYMKEGLRELGLAIADTVAPVAAFVSGSRESMTTLQQRLLSEGIFVVHSTYIGAGPNGAIRCGIFADHTRQHIDQLHSTLRRLL